MNEIRLATAAKVLKSIQYMTLATVCPDGSPWNTPLAPTFNDQLVFRWGSNEESTHSQNVRNEKRVFVVVYDSTVPEGTGFGVYMKGEAEELDEYEGVLKMYQFRPQYIWVNDEEKNKDGTFKRDVRIELDIEELKKLLRA